jgi:hypothetical protein
MQRAAALSCHNGKGGYEYRDLKLSHNEIRDPCGYGHAHVGHEDHQLSAWAFGNHLLQSKNNA